ncbi:MAG TPA: hypothetical protein VGB62_01600 [Allosphingosinicella sp.]|jgi:uncharacterized membrane protein
MRLSALAAALLLAACGSEQGAEAPPNAATPGETPAAPAEPQAPAGLPNAAPAENSAAPEAPAAPVPTTAAAPRANPCMVQGSETLTNSPFRATGTEPFWNARIEGRCVTYSHPEDQQGTRIWTRFVPARGGGTWSGTLTGKPFTLAVRPAPGCSDGMSDRRYPMSATLTVAGETRTGCAAPI